MHHKKQFLSTQQAADEFGVSTKTIRRWESQGKFKSIRTPGGHRRIILEKETKDTNISIKNALLLAAVATTFSSILTYLLTQNIYQQKLINASTQLENFPTNQENTSNKTQSSGISIIPKGETKIFISNSSIKKDDVINLTPTNPSIEINVDQIIPNLGFSISTPIPAQEPQYLNWQITPQ